MEDVLLANFIFHRISKSKFQISNEFQINKCQNFKIKNLVIKN